MEFAFTAEQEQLRDTIRAFLRNSAPSADLTYPPSLDRPLWTKLCAELGLVALPVDEEHGGFGASLVEVAVAVEELGAALSPLPYLATVSAAAAIDPASPAAALLPALCDGSLVGTLAPAGFDRPGGPSCTARQEGSRFVLDGVADHVLDGGVADIAVVAATYADHAALFAVPLGDSGPAASILDGGAPPRRTVHPTLDTRRGQARLEFHATPAVLACPSEDGGAAAAHASDLMLAMLAVESVGVAWASLDRTIEHLRTREQFGAPLATFQALRHRVADVFVRLEAATSSAWYAVRVAGTPEFAVAAPVAKLVATEAAYAVTAESIQLHGGIGFTWEHDAHRYFKRAAVNRMLYGDPITLRRLIGQRAGVGRPPR